MKRIGAIGGIFTAIVVASSFTAVLADSPEVVGEVRIYRTESPHPYPMGSLERTVVWSDTVISPGAQFIRVHFSDLSLVPGDYLTVSDPARTEVWTYTLRGPHGDGEFWAFSLTGDTAIVEIHGGVGAGLGYVIDAVGHGTELLIPPPIFESYCGPYERHDVACFMPSGPYPTEGFDAAQRPVARLDVIHGKRLSRCTGFLVDGVHPNTLITANSCVKNNKQARSLQAMFHHQSLYCNPELTAIAYTSVAPIGDALLSRHVVYSGDRLLRVSKTTRLDYTLLTLAGSAEADWGALIPSAQPVSPGTPFWLIQHPHETMDKKVGMWEDVPARLPCRIATVDATVNRTHAEGVEVDYLCYAALTTRGAPLVDANAPHHVLALHSGVNQTGPCMMNGTGMRHICEDAGSLLNCE